MAPLGRKRVDQKKRKQMNVNEENESVWHTLPAQKKQIQTSPQFKCFCYGQSCGRKKILRFLVFILYHIILYCIIITFLLHYITLLLLHYYIHKYKYGGKRINEECRFCPINCDLQKVHLDLIEHEASKITRKKANSLISN